LPLQVEAQGGGNQAGVGSGVGRLGQDVEAGKDAEAAVAIVLAHMAQALAAHQFEGQQTEEGLLLSDPSGLRQGQGIDHLENPGLDDVGQEQEDPGDLAGGMKGLESIHVQVPRDLGGQGVLGRQPALVRAAPAQFGEAGVFEHPLDRALAQCDALAGELLGDLGDRKVAPAHLANLVLDVGRDAALARTGGSAGKEIEFAHTKVVQERLEGLFAEVILAGGFLDRHGVDDVSAQGFVLALLGRLGIEEKSFQIVGHVHLP
jgi:hypothetical protein